MPALTEQEVESACDSFLETVDRITRPGLMSPKEALQSIDDVRKHVTHELQSRVDALEEDVSSNHS